MNCREVRDLLSPFVDGALDASRSGAVEQHLGSCAACRAELEALRGAVALVKKLEAPAPPPQFVFQVQAALQREFFRRTSRRGALSWYSALPRWAQGLAAAAAVLAVGVALASLVNLAGGPGAALGPGVESPSTLVGEAVPTPPPGEAGYAAPQKEGGGRAAAPQPAPAAPFAAGSPPAPSPGVGVLAPYEHKVIRSADLALRVEKLEEAYRRVVLITQAAKGFVEQSNLWTGGEGEKMPRGASFLLRVPSDSFERVLEDLGRLGEVVRLSQTGQDVSQEYYDLQARIRNGRRQEERLLELLGRAETVDEILRVEQELARVRGEIEVMQGRSNYLDQMVALSSIQVSLEEKGNEEPQPPDWGIWGRMWKAFWGTVLRMGYWIGRAVVFLAGAAPVVIILALAWWGWRRWRRSRR
ncbi:MAG: DUF4349 domain-containing protein [Acetobacteraceae bacterium]|nr:DUF4349 domain-containing protein [Acetobacteraceae bacterium]